MNNIVNDTKAQRYSKTIRGTTPTHSFTTDIDLSDVASIYITYSQEGRIVIEKTIEDVTFDDMRILVNLTQAETLITLIP